MKELWTIVWHDTQAGAVVCHVPPYDESMSDDTGLLVYRTEKSADFAAQHQTNLYGGSDMIARPMPLSEFLESEPIQPGQ